MCKLLSIFNFNEEIKINKIKMKKIAEIMSEGQKDGLGFFTDNMKNQYLEKGFPSIDMVNSITKTPVNSSFPVRQFKATEGTFQNNFNFLLMHSRTATNKKGIKETHPFKLDNKVFAHNGVVTIEKHDFPTETENDSEYLAHLFNNQGVESLPDVQGYFAFINYDIENRSVEICRDDMADLYMATNNKTGTVIIATKQYDIEDIIKVLGNERNWTCSVIIEDSVLFTVDKTGIKDVMSFEKVYYGNSGLNDLASKAFGKDVGKVDEYIDDDYYMGEVIDIQAHDNFGYIVTLLVTGEVFDVPTYRDHCPFEVGEDVEFYSYNGTFYFD